MKKLSLTSALIFSGLFAIACPVCERQQSKILRGITHGAGPDSSWDYIIVWTMVVIVLVSLCLSIRWLVRPGEKSDHHIKTLILNNQ
jgi:hypothetical protein